MRDSLVRSVSLSPNRSINKKYWWGDFSPLAALIARGFALLMTITCGSLVCAQALSTAITRFCEQSAESAARGTLQPIIFQPIRP